MKSISHQPRAMVLAIAIALGFATVSAGCSQGYDDTGKTPATEAGADANMDSTQPVNDTWITTKVKTALATMNGVDNTAVDVETNNGVVTLTGAAASQASVKAMSDAAMRVKGVSRVDTTGLTIGGAMDNGANDGAMAGGYAGNDQGMDSDQPVQDTWITTKVLGKLQTVDGLDNTDLAVETKNGVVALSGRADSQAVIDAAVAAAKTIKGVKEVDTSQLETGPDTDQ